jgi:hypothetical protein
MDVKLKVLRGAKSGFEVPLKKELFTIGRSSECSLRAGSDAISRKHCVIRLGGATLTITDLNSRNGTFVNGRRIDAETPLAHGDEIRVGPLEFEIVAEALLGVAAPPPEVAPGTAAARPVREDASPPTFEESIDQWLSSPSSDSRAMHETTSLRLDDTQGGAVPATAESQPEAAESADTADQPQAAESVDEAANVDEGSAIRKRKDKKEPGKLPTRPKGPTTKDSREAAAEVLRAMTRRR